MKWILQGLCIGFSVVSAFPVCAAKDYMENVVVGVDAVYLHNGFKKDHGQNMYGKNALGLKPYIDLMFHKHVGLELGCESYKNKKKQISLARNDRLAGGLLTQATDFEVKLRQYYPYVALTMQTTIVDDKTNIAANFGFDWARVKATFAKTTVAARNISNGICKKDKLIPALSLHLSRKVTDNASVKLSFGWKSTSKLRIQEQTNSTLELRMRNSLIGGLGFVWLFG